LDETVFAKNDKKEDFSAKIGKRRSENCLKIAKNRLILPKKLYFIRQK
jgi:hypothetical protein